MKRIRLVAAIFVASSLPAFAQQTGAQNLYERLGGMRGISMVVDDFINRLVANETLNNNAAIDAGRKASPAPYLKFEVATLMCEVTGGPCKYAGRGMKEAHAHLNITEQEWNVMAAEFEKSLIKFRGSETEQRAFDIVSQTKPDIVLKSLEKRRSRR
jgi:hemoglobin